jgi:anti-anti-sigma factor
MSGMQREAVTDVFLVNLSGPLNASQAAEVIQLFRDLHAGGVQSVLVNLAKVPFIDSQGLTALIAAYKIFGRDARNIRLVGIQDQPRLVFELTGFDRVFDTLVKPAEGVFDLAFSDLRGQVLPTFVALPRDAGLDVAA